MIPKVESSRVELEQPIEQLEDFASPARRARRVRTLGALGNLRRHGQTSAPLAHQLGLLIVLCGATCTLSGEVSLPLSGTGARGGLWILGFDTEMLEPSAPPSRQHSEPPNSHGFPYFQYRWDAENPDFFNRFADPNSSEDCFWGIVIASHPTRDTDGIADVLKRAGAKAWGAIGTATTQERNEPGDFNLGLLTYPEGAVAGQGLEQIPAADVAFHPDRSDFHLNALDEPTEPGTWIGYPYYYWGLDAALGLRVGELQGAGLLMLDGRVIGIDLACTAEITAGGLVVASGSLEINEGGFRYRIQGSRFLPGVGEVHVSLDREGPLDLQTGVTLAASQLTLQPADSGFRLDVNGWPERTYRIERSGDLRSWMAVGHLDLNAQGFAHGEFAREPDGNASFFRAIRLTQPPPSGPEP